MNKKSIVLYLLAAVGSAQDYRPSEFQAVYLQGYIDSGLDRQDPALTGRFKPRRMHTGLSASAVSNFSRISGLKLEVSWMRDNRTIQGPAGRFSLRQDPLWLLFGVQLKDNHSSKRLKPFAHIMGGFARFETSSSALSDCAAAFALSSCPARFHSRRWSQAYVAGGGIDLRISERIDIRILQLDYAPIARFGKTLHSVRVGLGVVFQ